MSWLPATIGGKAGAILQKKRTTIEETGIELNEIFTRRELKEKKKGYFGKLEYSEGGKGGRGARIAPLIKRGRLWSWERPRRLVENLGGRKKP